MIILNIVFIVTLVITGQANAAPKRRYQASNQRSTRGGEEVYGAADSQISTGTRDNNFNLKLLDELPLYESRSEFSQEALGNILAVYDLGIKFMKGTTKDNNLSPAAIFGYGNKHPLAQAIQAGSKLVKAQIKQSSRVRDILDVASQTESADLFSKKEDTQILKKEASTLLQKNEQSPFRYETSDSRGNLRPPYSGNNIKKNNGPSLQSQAHLTPLRGSRENITPSYLREPHCPHNTPSKHFGRIESIHNQYGRTVNEEAYDQNPVQENELQGSPLQLPKEGTYKIISIEDAINHGLYYFPIEVAVVDTALLDINIFGMSHQKDNKHQLELQNEPLSLANTDQSNEIRSDGDNPMDSVTHTNAAVEPNSRTQDINQQVYTLEAYGEEDAAADYTTEVKPDIEIQGETEAQANEVVETNNDNYYNADTQSEEIVQPNGKTKISSSEEDDVALQSRFGSHSNKPSQDFDLHNPATKYSGKVLYYDANGNLIYDRFDPARVHRYPYMWDQN